MINKGDLTPRENEVLALAWQCFEQEPKVDTVKLASLTGYTPGSASFAMNTIKRKLKNKVAGVSTNNPALKGKSGRPRAKATPKANTTPKANITPKRGAAKGGDDTPSKRQKATVNCRNNNYTSSSNSPSFIGDDDEDEDFFGIRNATIVKKEEACDNSFPELDSPIHDEKTQPASYNFLEGIGDYTGRKGSGIGGYRASYAEDK